MVSCDVSYNAYQCPLIDCLLVLPYEDFALAESPNSCSEVSIRTVKKRRSALTADARHALAEVGVE